MSEITVSIVVAVYNAEKYLRQAITSILDQTYREIEVIAVDDGSVDASLRILREFEHQDERLTVYENREESDGAAAARNLGISHANGEFLMVLDSDDFFEPDMIEKAVGLAESQEADVVVFDGYRFDDKNQVDLERNSILCRDKLPGDRNAFAPIENKDNLFVMTIGAAWNALFSMELVRKHQLRFRSFHHADDFEFVYLAFAHAERIAVLPERLVHYRVNHAGSQAANVNKWPDTAWQSMLSFRDALIRDGLFEDFRIAFLRVAARYLYFYINNMSDTDSFVKLFLDLKDRYLEELGLKGEQTNETEIDDESLYRLMSLIGSATPQEYLFRKLNKKPPFDSTVSWKDSIPENAAIALWGADRIGTEVFYDILWERHYRVVIWVDAQYKELGYPVKSTEELEGSTFDYVLVSAPKGPKWEGIREQLIGIGIADDRILRIGDKKRS